jgi:ribulose-5-phosphate 4-epimerase/fuculose-1-phosphate aldolase
MSPAEWQARCDLAALYRIVDHFGWTDVLATHMSVRVPGEPNCFLINHYQELFQRDHRFEPDQDGPRGQCTGQAGPLQQGRLHHPQRRLQGAARMPTARCTRTRVPGAGAAMLRHGLRPISQDAMIVYDDIVYHDYGMPATQEECDALGQSIQQGSCVVLRNHGLLTLGATVHGTLMNMYMLERACELEVLAASFQRAAGDDRSGSRADAWASA